MNNDKLKEFIYDQLYAASMYAFLKEIAPDDHNKNLMVQFEIECRRNASYLDRYYQEYNTSSYNPILQKPYDAGGYFETVVWMLRYESKSYFAFYTESYNTFNEEEIRTLLRYIIGILNGHSLGLTEVYLNQKKTPPEGDVNN